MKKIITLLSCIVMLFIIAGCGKEEDYMSGLHHVKMEIEDYGTIELELDADTAPITVNNFITLAKDGFYDGLTFHRIMEGFMMQGGAYNGSDENAPKTIKGEFSNNGVDNNISHVRGVISMARVSGMNDSASSQFFIVHQDSTFLDGDYAAFGHVTNGMDVVDKICETAEPIDNNGTILESKQPKIKKVTVID